MSFASYHHGTRLSESAETPALVQVAQSAVVGLLGTAPDADAAVFPINTPVLLPGSSALAESLGATGTLADAVDDVFDQTSPYCIVIRVEEGVDTDATITNLVGDSATMTGVHALKKAKALTGQTPRIIAVPGFTSDDSTTANAVAAELVGILEELRAVAIIDGPDTSDANAIASAALYGSERLYMVDPKVLVWDTDTGTPVARPASARVAGVQARVDAEQGFWWSLSNKVIQGVVGVNRAVSYGAQANNLNENMVGTIINNGAGFITWGNRGLGSESLWAFLSVRRTADFINEALIDAYMEYVDKPFSTANIKFMVESGNTAMRSFKDLGAIIGGKVWIDPAKNEPADMAAGKITLSVKFEPPAPMEDIRFNAYREIEYYVDLVEAALKSAA